MIARVAAALSRAPGRPGQRKDITLTPAQLLALHAVAIIAVLTPMAIATYPPLVDYPNHLARIHVLATLGNDPLLQEKYAANWSLLPNLAMDAILVPLARLFPIYAIGKVFVLLTMLLFIAGTYALRWVIWRRIGLWPAVALLVVYNHALAWGFLNYLFGVGLSLLSLAFWLWTRDRWSWRVRLPVFSAIAVGLFFAHLFALGIYGLLVASHELGRSLGRRDLPIANHLVVWMREGLQFVLPALLLFAGPVVHGNSVTMFGLSWTKIVYWLSAPMFHFEAVGAVTLIFMVVLFLVAGIMGALRLSPEMKLPLAALALATLAMPSWLFNAWGADLRLSPVVVAVAVASTNFESRRGMFKDVMLILGVVLLGMRVVGMHKIARDNDARVSELRAAIGQAIKPGSSVMIVDDIQVPSERRRSRSKRDTWFITYHYGAYAVIDRSVFLPTLFTERGKQPLQTTSKYAHIDTPFGPTVAAYLLRRSASGPWADRNAYVRDQFGRVAYWAHWPSWFDYAIVIRRGERANPAPRYLRPVATGTFFTIYAVGKRGR